MISCHPIFDLPYIWCHTGAYSLFGWDLYISIDLREHPQLRDARWADDLTSLCLDYPMEPFLIHSVRPIFSDVVMILGCNYLRCIDSRINISMEYRSDLLYVLIELFSSYQDKSNALVAILGHIPPFQSWRWLFSQRFVIIHITRSRDVYSHWWSQSRWFLLRWAFSRSWPQGFDCRTIHDSSVDWDRSSYLSGLFSCDSPVDHSFNTTMDLFNKTSRVRGIRIIVMLHQALCFS